MSEMDTDAIRAGTLLAGKYRVERVLGAGGMGVVVAARHVYLQEEVAIKLLHGDRAQLRHSADRLMREARAASRIRSEHVARVFDVGLLDDGAPYIVMERLSGTDLANLLDRDGALPPATAVDYLLQACEAMAEAHVLGIVHRDLKPANLYLTHRMDGSACIKVLDFGISKTTRSAREAGDSSPPSAAGPGRWDVQTVDPPEEARRRVEVVPANVPARDLPSVSLTGTDARVGSPRYMSPEQLRGSRTVDARSDIWSLGTILYELVTGVPAFVGASAEELETAILERMPMPMTQHRTALPRGLEEVVGVCLTKDVTRRPPDVASLARSLAPFGSSSARTSAERIAKIAATNAAHHDAETPRHDAFAVSQVQPSRRARRWLGFSALAVAGVALATTARIAWTRHAPSAAAAPPSAEPSAAVEARPATPPVARAEPATDPVASASPPPSLPPSASPASAPPATSATLRRTPPRQPTSPVPSATSEPASSASSLHLDPGSLFDGRK
jgi:serine/threonine-protein kinase